MESRVYAQVIRKSYYRQGMLSDLAQSMVVVLSAVLWSYSLFDIHCVNVLITKVKGFLKYEKKRRYCVQCRMYASCPK